MEIRSELLWRAAARAFTAVAVLGGCESAQQSTAADVVAGPFQCVTYEVPRLLVEGGPDAGQEPWFGSVGEAKLVPRGGFVVADRQRFMVHFFDAEGRSLGSTGRRGDGPGEFRFIHTLVLQGDTVEVRDGILRRSTRYTTAGVFLGDRPNPEPRESRLLLGPFDDGSFVAGFNVTRLSRGTEPQLFQDLTEIRHISTDGTVIRIIGTFPQATRYSDLSQGTFDVGITAYGRAPSYHGIGDRLLIAKADSPVIHIVRLDGSTERSIEVPDMSRTVDGELVRLFREHSRSGSHSVGDRFGFPDRTPPYGGVTIDRSGRIWISSPPVPPNHQQRFIVVDQQGSVLEDLALTHSGAIRWMDASDDALLVRVEDDLGVAAVAVHQRSCAGSQG